MHSLKVPSFFFTNNTGAPQYDTFVLINPRSNGSCNLDFSSFNSIRAILYSAIKNGVVPETTSMANSTSLSGVKFGNSEKMPVSSRPLELDQSFVRKFWYLKYMLEKPQHLCVTIFEHLASILNS